MTAKKTVVVTGVSTGIGATCVKILAAAGFHVFGSMRKEADAERMSAVFTTLATRSGCSPLAALASMTASVFFMAGARLSDRIICGHVGLTPTGARS